MHRYIAPNSFMTSPNRIERLLMMVLLFRLGSIAASGRLLAHTDWRVIIVAVLALVLVRPLLGWISLIGSGHPHGEAIWKSGPNSAESEQGGLSWLPT